MKKSILALLAVVALCTSFAIGSHFASATGAGNSSSQANSVTPQPQTEELKNHAAPQAKEAIPNPCREYLVDGPFRAKLNGKKLHLAHNPRFEDEFADAKIKALSTGRMLVGLGDTLYLLNDKRQVEWKVTVPQFLYDFASIESTGMIYVTAGDNNMLILELTTGKELYQNGRNGSAAYGQVEPYGTDQCLILDNYVGYRWKLSEKEKNDPQWWTPELMGDGITAWRGTELLWSRDFPPDAELLVNGRKIYAVTKTKSNIYIREVTTPER